MKRKTIDDVLLEFNNTHNFRYDYSKVVYINNHTPVIIICKDHGEFLQTPKNHINGFGCSMCSGKKRYTNETFIFKANQKHNFRYDYSKVVYINIRSVIIIICKDHGEFKKMAKDHLRGEGCPKCSAEQRKNVIDHYSDKLIDKHNKKYDYSKVVYNTIKEKVVIVCPIHGEFIQRFEDHINGHGCPKCASMISKEEVVLSDFIGERFDIITNSRKIIPPYELDIVIPSKKIAIEYNGIYWHGEQQGKDSKYHFNKYLMCKEAGYRLIQVWENEWLQKKDIVKSIILSALGVYERKIHGRKCVLKTVNNNTARQFYEENHIQGFKGGEHHGLYYNDVELVSLMTINNLNILERFVNSKNALIHGAFSKLLKSFDNIEGLVTFADLRYFTGNVYEKNGFEYQHTSNPNYFYFNNNDKINLQSRIQFQKHKLINKLDKFDPELTEYQNMLANGYDRIWDCGNLKYLLPTNR
jgi:very-short-patch-repair endonuclease